VSGSSAPPERATRDRLRAALAGVGVSAGPEAEWRLLRYWELLRRWNRRFNLIARTELANVFERHIADCAVIAPHLAAHPAASITDLGSGAGLPGLVLASLDPSRDYRLVDARGNKTRFLRQAVAELGLPRVEVLGCRVEALEPTGGLLLARALAPLPRLVRICATLLDEHAALWTWKGPKFAREASDLGDAFRVDTVTSYQLWLGGVTYRVVCVTRRWDAPSPTES